MVSDDDEPLPVHRPEPRATTATATRRTVEEHLGDLAAVLDGAPAATDYIEFDGRPHLLMAAEGWEEVASSVDSV